jgi:hypothetical protein
MSVSIYYQFKSKQDLVANGQLEKVVQAWDICLMVLLTNLKFVNNLVGLSNHYGNTEIDK